MAAKHPHLPLVHQPVGDRGLASKAAAIAAGVWGLAAPLTVIRFSMNATFRSDDVVLRVGRPTEIAANEIVAGILTDVGIRGPVLAGFEPLRVGDLTVTAYRFEIADGSPIDWALVGETARVLHDRVDPAEIPAMVPLADPRRLPWWDFDGLLSSLEASTLITPEISAALHAEVALHAGWHELVEADRRVTHGDIHPGNVIQTSTGPVLLDWDLLSFAPPAWDHAPLLGQAIGPWDLDRQAYEDFAAGYGQDLSDDPTTRSFARLRDLAATLMRVRAAHRDPSQAEEAQLRLKYWVDGSIPRPWFAQ